MTATLAAPLEFINNVKALPSIDRRRCRRDKDIVRHLKTATFCANAHAGPERFNWYRNLEVLSVCFGSDATDTPLPKNEAKRFNTIKQFI